MDDVRIWRGARSETDIASHMNCPLAGNEPGLIGYWDLEAGTGSIVADKSPSGATGILTTGASWTTIQALNCTTSIPFAEPFMMATISPNPSAGLVNITTSTDLKNATLFICNVIGQVVLQKQHMHGGSNIIDYRALPYGVYFVRIMDSNTGFTGKIVLSK